MIIFSPLFGAIGVMLGILTIWAIFKFDKPFIKALDETNEKEHIVSSTLFDSLSNIITVITLQTGETYGIQSSEKRSPMYFLPFMKNVRINEWKWFVADMLVGLVYAVTVVGYIYQHWEPGKVFMVGNLVALLGFVNQFTSVFHDVAWQYTQIVQFDTDVKTSRFITQAYKEHHLPDEVQALPDGLETYFNQRTKLFAQRQLFIERTNLQSSRHLNYIRKRKAYCLYRRKRKWQEHIDGTCSADYLLHSLEPSISVDDKTNVSINAISSSITLFPQEPEIFENTIEHNITLGLPFDEQQIMEVCGTAQFDEVVRTSPKKLQSNIQEKGVNLSGGQKQRLALARGILAAKSSDIVLLDEPTSSVDSKTENQIYEKLFEEFNRQGRCI